MAEFLAFGFGIRFGIRFGGRVIDAFEQIQVDGDCSRAAGGDGDIATLTLEDEATGVVITLDLQYALSTWRHGSHPQGGRTKRRALQLLHNRAHARSREDGYQTINDTDEWFGHRDNEAQRLAVRIPTVYCAGIDGVTAFERSAGTKQQGDS